MSLHIFFRVGKRRRCVGTLEEDFALFDKPWSMVSLLIYLLSFLPKASKITEVVIKGEELIIKASGISLRVLIEGPSYALFKLRELLALRSESRYLDSLNLLFRPSEGSFFDDAFGSLELIEREVKSKFRGKDKKTVCTILKELRKSIKFVYKRFLVDERSHVWERNHERLKRHPGVNLVDEYFLGPFVIRINKNDEMDELRYNVEYSSNSYLIPLGSRFISHVLAKYADLEVEYKMKLDELIDYRVIKSRGIIRRSLREVPESLLDTLSAISAYRSLNLLKFMPFLLDENICEFYVDAPDTFLYLDHFKHGRCISNVKVSMSDLMSFITHIKLESGLPLDLENPSLKADISNKLFKIRVSIDIPPLAVDGPTIDVRKFRIMPFTLPELIQIGTLSVELASIILLYAKYRANIVIIGEPGSGKTTLLNAIDICLPNFFRRVYIEDVVESIPLHILGKHQVRLRVDPIEVSEAVRTKKREILKLLHRKPDYVILGELQSKEHFEAALSAMVSGLKCIQTCHADSLEQFLDRLVYDYGFSLNLVRRTYDLIIVLKRHVGVKEFRRVIQAAEVLKTGKELFLPIYSYPMRVKVIDVLHSSGFFKRVTEREGKRIDSLIKEYELYRNALNYMVQRKIFDANDVAALFNKVVYKYISKVAGGATCPTLERILKLK